METRIERAREGLGLAAGALLAPLFGIGSALRGARVLHPSGRCYRAEVTPVATDPALGRVASRLAGPALVRLSSAWWRGDREWPDLLGCALRFGGAEPEGSAQDLLLATTPSAWLLPLGPLWTDVHDFLRNRYYGIAPFQLDEGGRRARLRLVPMGGALGLGASGGDGVGVAGREGRDGRLRRAVAEGRAVLRLEARPRLHLAYQPLALVRLTEPVALDQAALRFSPFRSGRGLRPVGFLHALRRLPYLLSQLARPEQGRELPWS